VQIPTSKTCNESALPQGCVRVPPVFEGPTYVVDGVRDSQEYWGAIELPYANTTARASGGRVLATITDDHVAGNAETLHLYLEQIPVDINARELVVYLDRDRFTFGTSSVERTNDVAFAINLETGALSTRSPVYRFGIASWRPRASFGATSAALAPDGCVIAEGQLAPVRRCNAEFAIELPPDPLFAPDPAVLPGLGLAVSDDGFGSALPEELARGPTTGLERSFDRTFYVTLLFGRPRPIPFKFATWNVRRFSTLEQCLTADEFQNVDLRDQAAVMAENDVIALQELWTVPQARTLLRFVNERRATLDLPPMNMFGPVNFPNELMRGCGASLSKAAGLICQLVGPGNIDLDNETHGGLFIFSRYPAIDSDYIVFDDCRGEDCLKAKGVQWVRLALAPATEDNTRPECLQNVPGSSCPPAPSSELFIDVFNTHLKADNTELCLGPVTAIAAPLLDPLNCGPLAVAAESDFFCLDAAGPAAVREKQLVQLGTFVARVAASAPGHFSIVAGDLNINGRQIGRGRRRSGFGYTRILGELALGADGAPDFAPIPDDNISPWPSAFDWDIDHGDVARETPRDWLAAPCLGEACSIGTSGELEPDGARLEANDCDHVEDARLDYLMVRPRIAPDVPTAEFPQYLVSREASPADVWTARWPSDAPPDDTICEIPPALVSDHRMVVGALGITPLRVPPRYHPLWEHDVTFQITSYDATGESDCWLDLCSPIDAMSRISGSRQRFDGSSEFVPGTPFSSAVCEASKASVVTNACMSSWVFTDRHVPSEHRQLDPLCQRRVRQLPLAIFVLMGGEWFPKRAEAIPGSQS